MARETMSWSCSEERVHCAVCIVIGFHVTGTESKLSAGGGSSEGAFTSSFTAGVDARLDMLGDISERVTWTPCSRRSGGLESKLAAASGSCVMLGVWNWRGVCGRDPVGELRPEYAGTVSSEGEVLPLLRVRGMADLNWCRRVRGPLGRGRGEVGVVT